MKTLDLHALCDRLAADHTLTETEYAALIDGRTPELAAHLAELAVAARQAVYGREVYIRGLIEISNYCKNDCLYCGIRRSNRACSRYRLTADDILAACDEGHALGFRTFVWQGGEDAAFSDDLLCDMIRTVKARYPDCAVTLSLGERSRESYRLLARRGRIVTCSATKLPRRGITRRSILPPSRLRTACVVCMI